jgi:hypothetical protein
MPKNHALEEREDHEALPGNSAQASQNVIEIVERVKVGYNLRDGIPKISLVPDEEYLNEKIKEDIFRLFNKIETPEERKNLISELQESFANSAKDHEHMSVPLWKNRTTGREVSPADWIRMHYSRQLEAGTLTRSALLNDPELYNAYAKWIKRHPEDDLHLPKGTRKDALSVEEAAERRRASSRASYHRNKAPA